MIRNSKVVLTRDPQLGSMPETWSLTRVGTGPGRTEGTGFRSEAEARKWAKEWGHEIVEVRNMSDDDVTMKHLGLVNSRRPVREIEHEITMAESALASAKSDARAFTGSSKQSAVNEVSRLQENLRSLKEELELTKKAESEYPHDILDNAAGLRRGSARYGCEGTEG